MNRPVPSFRSRCAVALAACLLAAFIPSTSRSASGSDGTWIQAGSAPFDASGGGLTAVSRPTLEAFVFGGFTTNGVDPSPSAEGCRVALNGQSSIPMAPGPAVGDHSAIYDADYDRMVVFGGDHVYGANPVTDELWVFGVDANSQWTWSLLDAAGTPPSPRRSHSAIYDPIAHRMIVFGGTDKPWLLSGGNTTFDDVFLLSLGGPPTWSAVPHAGPWPAPRSGHTAVYDPTGDRMIVFGGRGADGTLLNDVWALELRPQLQWVQLSPTGPPPPEREGHTSIVDDSRQRMVVFGGTGSAADVWSLSLNGPPAWSQLAPDGTPPGSGNNAAVCDFGDDRMMLFHGTGEVWLLQWSFPLAVENGARDVALRIDGVSPNPSLGPIDVRYTLPAGRGGLLELLDVSGRCIARRAVLGAGGVHSEYLETPHALAPGIYLVRISSRGEVATRRVAVTR